MSEMVPLSMAYHAGAETLDDALASADGKTAVIAAKCLGLLMGYDRKWARAPFRIDSVEAVLTSDLWNPETGRKSRSFTCAGKIDVRATDVATGAKVVFDHKTASQDIADPNSDYWRQLVIEGQVSHYLMLEWLNENKVDFGLWDVIRKPGISPKTLAKKDMAAVVETKTYFGQTLTDDELEQVKAEERETPLMYAARLSYDCSAERPEWYFQRRRVPRLDSELLVYGMELWGHGQDILTARNSARWPRNSGACFTYNTACEYLALCSGHDHLESGEWVKRPWVHPELPILDGTDGKDVLTNSRVRCFQTCRQKHYLRYELGVERLAEEEKDARYFGSLFHTALEAYFLALQQEQTKGTA